MNVDKFIEENCILEDFIDFRNEYTIADVSGFPEYWEDATPADFEELLTIIEEYIKDQKDIAISDELETIETHIRDTLYDYREFCPDEDIMRLLVKLANDYV